MKPKAILLIVLLCVGFVGLLLYSTLSLRRVRVETCVEFQGKSACRIAAGPSEPEAMRTALDNACALVASGVTESRLCTTTPPKSTRRLE